MTIPEHFPYTPAPGGWPPQGEWQPYPPPPPPQPPRRRNNKLIAAIGGGVAALVLAAGAGFGAGWSLHPDSAAQGGLSGPVLPFNPGDGAQGGGFPGGGFGSGQDGSGQNGSTAGGATDSQVAQVAAKVDPALVDIDTVLGAQNAEAAGTGIVISSDGVVLTNNHVVAGATSITVTDIGNHKNYRAAVVGYDRSHDIAVIKLANASGLTTATLAGNTNVKAGDPVVAIGNAGGTGGVPSAVGGAVSAVDQSITASDESSGSSERLTGLIEVNADIQAGDSGGPLLTTDGQVIGVDTAASTGFQFQGGGGGGGDGFAIPISTATTIANQIRGGQASGTVHIGETAYLGIETTSSQQGAGESGAAVLGVVPGAPAEAAGLSRGDVITSVDGTSVADATALTNVLDRFHPGDHVKVTWTSLSGQSQTGTIKLATGPVG